MGFSIDNIDISINARISLKEISSSLDALMSIHLDCQKETNLDQGLAQQAMVGQFVDDPVMKKHVLCIFKKLGTMNADGSINKDRMRTVVGMVVKDENLITKYVDECSVVKDIEEDTAFEVSKCLIQKANS